MPLHNFQADSGSAKDAHPNPEKAKSGPVSEVWWAAALRLLSDVRGEIGDLVSHVPEGTRPSRQSPIGDPLVTKNGLRAKRSAVLPEPQVIADGDEADAAADDEETTASPDWPADDSAAIGATTRDDAQSGAESSSLNAYLRQLRRLKPLDAEVEVALVRAAKAGHEGAMNQLISQHLRIVPPLARAFVGRGLPLEDLIEEGNLGLYRAVPRFDPEMGHRFSTYARWWVKHEIRTAVLNQGRLIRLPVHVFRALSKVRRQLEAGGQVMPYVEQASDERGHDGVVDTTLRFTLNEARTLLQLTQLPMSLDVPSDAAAEAMPLVETLAGEIDDSPEQRIQNDQRTRLLNSAMERLSKNEREVVMRRYGFAGGEPETLEAIGKTLKLTAERVRQIQKAALTAIQADFSQRGISLDVLL